MLRTAKLEPRDSDADYYTALGMMSVLGATSAFGELPFNRAVAVLHCALKSGNFNIYVGSNDKPSAALVWAYLNDQTTEEYLAKGFLANIEDWNSGNDLWFLNVIAEGGIVKDIIEDAVYGEQFKDYDEGFMLRANNQGKRRIVAFNRNGLRLVRTLPKEK